MKNENELNNYAKKLVDDVFDKNSIPSRVYALKLIIDAYHTGYRDAIEDNKKKSELII